MPSSAYYLGHLLVVFGGFLVLGRTLFAGASELFGPFGLILMIVGAIVGASGLAGAPTSANDNG